MSLLDRWLPFVLIGIGLGLLATWVIRYLRGIKVEVVQWGEGSIYIVCGALLLNIKIMAGLDNDKLLYVILVFFLFLAPTTYQVLLKNHLKSNVYFFIHKDYNRPKELFVIILYLILVFLTFIFTVL